MRYSHLGAVTGAIALLTTLSSFAPLPQAKAEDVKIIKVAIDLPFTGAAAESNTSMAKAFELAVHEANAKGFPGNILVQVERFDHGRPGVSFDADLAAQTAKQNVSDPQILSVFGTRNSAAAKAEIPILNAGGLAMISAVNTNPDLTKGGAAAALRVAHPDEIDYFRVCGTDDQQGAAGAQLVEQRGLRTAYVLDNNNTYGKGLADAFDVAFRATGGTVITHEQVDIGKRDFSDVIARIKEKNPSVVYFGADEVQLGPMRKQMVEAGIGNIPFYAGDSMGDDTYTKIAGNAAFNSYYTVMSPNGLYLTNPMAKQFNTSFERAYHTKPGAFDAAAYAAGQVEMTAIRNAIVADNGNVPSRAQVRSQIAHTKSLPTAIGPITFDDFGDVRDPYISYYTFDKAGKTVFIRQFILKEHS